MYSSYTTIGLNPRTCLMLSSGVKALWLALTFDEISTIEPRVEYFGLIVKGYVASVI